jgi:hypothetical protein
MKLATRILSLLVLVTLTMFYVGCDKNKGEDESEQSIQFKKLTGTWTVSSVTDANGPREDFEGVTLILGGTFAENASNFTYNVNGTLPDPSPWPKGAHTWKFGTDPSTDVIRDPGTDDEIPCEYVVSSDGKSLQVSFSIPDGGGFAGGRTSSVVGAWTFNFTKP